MWGLLIRAFRRDDERRSFINAVRAEQREVWDEERRRSDGERPAICPVCKGGRLCWSCNGSQRDRDGDFCGVCSGTGSCDGCGGSGER